MNSKTEVHAPGVVEFLNSIVPYLITRKNAICGLKGGKRCRERRERKGSS